MQEVNTGRYKLTEERFRLLSCSEIVDILESPKKYLISSKPLFKIELIYKNGPITTIEPKWNFEGTIWSIICDGKETYIENQYVKPFLKEICFDKYVCFNDRFYLLFQIADSLGKNEQLR